MQSVQDEAGPQYHARSPCKSALIAWKAGWRQGSVLLTDSVHQLSLDTLAEEDVIAGKAPTRQTLQDETGAQCHAHWLRRAGLV